MLLPFFLYWLLLYFQESECDHQPLPDFDIAEIVQTVINEVKISNSNANFKFFMDHVVPDIELFIYKTGQTRLKMYATTLQKFYTSGTNLQEADIKRILKAVVTKILSKIDVLDGKFSQEVFLTDTDKSIVFYLAGAVLKWGITKFKGEERSYCQSHTSSESSDFPEVYHFINKKNCENSGVFVVLMLVLLLTLLSKNIHFLLAYIRKTQLLLAVCCSAIFDCDATFPVSTNCNFTKSQKN